MTQLDDRERAYENKFARDEELRFKAEARRNRLLGHWAAEKLGKTSDEAEAYAKEVVRADFEEPGHEDVFRKVQGDLKAAGVSVTDEEIRTKMVELLVTAAEQIEANRR